MKRALLWLSICALSACDNGSGERPPDAGGVDPALDSGGMSDGDASAPDDRADGQTPGSDGASSLDGEARADGASQLADGGTGEYRPSPELTSLLTRFASLRAGQPVDLDGDGRADTALTTNSDGSRTWSSDQDGEGTPEFVLTQRADGSTVLIDKNRDGSSDEELVITVSETTHRRVAQVDEDFDGKPDHRYTWTTERASIAQQSYLAEIDRAGTGTYTPLASLTLTSTKDQDGDSCEGSDGFPSDGDDYQPFPGSPTIKTSTALLRRSPAARPAPPTAIDRTIAPATRHRS